MIRKKTFFFHKRLQASSWGTLSAFRMCLCLFRSPFMLPLLWYIKICSYLRSRHTYYECVKQTFLRQLFHSFKHSAGRKIASILLAIYLKWKAFHVPRLESIIEWKSCLWNIWHKPLSKRIFAVGFRKCSVIQHASLVLMSAHYGCNSIDLVSITLQLTKATQNTWLRILNWNMRWNDTFIYRAIAIDLSYFIFD